MKKSILTALAVFLISGYIGFSTNYVNTSKASSKVVVLQPMQMPQPKNPGFNVSLDLNKDVAVITNTDYDNIKIDVTRKDSVVHDTLVVSEKVPYPVKVQVEKLIPTRVTPPFAKAHKKPVVLASMANSY